MVRLLGLRTWVTAAATCTAFYDFRQLYSAQQSAVMLPEKKSSANVSIDIGQLRLLVIGKTGNGKSTLGNKLLGANRFQTDRSMSPKTLEAQDSATWWNGTQVTVVDTPDPINLDGDKKPQLNEEIQRWKSLTSPNPSAILLAIRCDVRYTAEEYAVYRRIKAAWKDNSFTRHLVVAFTFGDRQDKDIKEELKSVCPELQSVLSDASQRYIVFNNQVSNRDELLAEIQEFVRRMDMVPQAVPRWYMWMQAALAGMFFFPLFLFFYGKSSYALKLVGIAGCTGLALSEWYRQRQGWRYTFKSIQY